MLLIFGPGTEKRWTPVERVGRMCTEPQCVREVSFVVIFGFGDGRDAILQDVVSAEQLQSGFTVEGERETYLHRIEFSDDFRSVDGPAGV